MLESILGHALQAVRVRLRQCIIGKEWDNIPIVGAAEKFSDLVFVLQNVCPEELPAAGVRYLVGNRRRVGKTLHQFEGAAAKDIEVQFGHVHGFQREAREGYRGGIEVGNRESVGAEGRAERTRGAEYRLSAGDGGEKILR